MQIYTNFFLEDKNLGKWKYIFLNNIYGRKRL